MTLHATRAAYQRFPHNTLDITHSPDPERAKQTARDLRAAIEIGVLMSLGATDLGAVAGSHQLGGLLFTARILPLRHGTRRTRPARMGVMISLNGIDTIDIRVIEYASGRQHATATGLYIDQLNACLLALDYDGPTPFNPRYWSN